MKDKKILILLLIAGIIVIETTYLTIRLWMKGFPKVKCATEFDIQRKIAEEYLNYDLYEPAIASYEKYLLKRGMILDKKANISYIIGNIYMDNLSDYKNALASFARAKVFSPSNPSISEVNKKIVMCLERLGKPVDAERELSKITSIVREEEEQTPKSKTQEIIIAKIGDRNITMAELDSEIEKLPAFLRDSYAGKDKKVEFLEQYIVGELLYDSAKRMGFDEERDVIDAMYRVRKQLIVEKLIDEEVNAKLPEPTQGDLKLYYEANKDKYIEEDTDEEGNVTKRQKDFSEIEDSVKTAYTLEKQQERLNILIGNLMGTKEVKIYKEVFEEEEKE